MPMTFQAPVSGGGNLAAAGIALCMPPKLHAVRDWEASIYWDALTEVDGLACPWEVEPSLTGGTQQVERMRIIPAGRHSGTTVTVSAINALYGSVDVSAQIALWAASPAAGAGQTLTYLQIGDSTTANSGEVTQTILDRAAFDALSVTLVGTKGSGSNKYEATAGWSLQDYTRSGSPFWFSGAINFGQYLSTNSLATPDVVGVLLGTNDMLGVSTDAACDAVIVTAFSGLDALITSIRAANASAKIVLYPIPMPSADQDAFGANYGTALSRWRYKRNAIRWNRALIAAYAGREAGGIYISAATLGYDNRNNARYAGSSAANVRSAVSINRLNNGVHPESGGYLQIGDGVFATLKCLASDTANEYSAELIPDPKLQAAGSWSAGSGWVVSGGTATATAANTPLSATIGAYAVGDSFLVTIVVGAMSAGQFRAVIGGKAGAWRFGAGKFTEVITTLNAGTTADLYGASGLSGTLKWVSIRKITA